MGGIMNIDATWETQRWYKDVFVNSSKDWIARSGNTIWTFQAGAFLYNLENGTYAASLFSFRTVLIP